MDRLLPGHQYLVQWSMHVLCELLSPRRVPRCPNEARHSDTTAIGLMVSRIGRLVRLSVMQSHLNG